MTMTRSSVRSIVSLTLDHARAVKRLFFFLRRPHLRRKSQTYFSQGSMESRRIYSPKALGPIPGSSRAELDRFQTDGWIGPYPLLRPEGARIVCEIDEMLAHRFQGPHPGHVRSLDAFSKRPWFKSMHAHIPEFYDLVGHPAILKRVASILGPDLMAWGFSVMVSPPGKIHRWHVDAEHRRWRGVTVFLGLRNISTRSTLKVINGSHRIPRSPQDLSVTDDRSALAASRKFKGTPRLMPVPLKEGEFFIFDGPLWHGSWNTSDRTRTAAILQYSPLDQEVRVPLGWDEPIQWHPTPPPCVLVQGKDRRRLNRLVDRPGGSTTKSAQIYF